MWKLILLPLALAVLVLGACGDDDDDSTDDASGSASPEVTVCDQMTEVESSVTALTALDVVEAGTDARDAAVADVRTEVDTLQEIVSDEVADEVQTLSDAVDTADELLSDDDETVNEQIDEVQAAVTDVATAASAVTEALSQECS